MERHITLPLTREEARNIKSGEQLLLSGVIYTARDAAHKRLCELVEKGELVPIRHNIPNYAFPFASTVSRYSLRPFS